MLRKLCLAILVLMLPSLAHATTWYDTDFETCAVGTGNDFPCENWTDAGLENVNSLRMSTLQAFSGSKAVRLTLNNINGSKPGGNININNNAFTSNVGTTHHFMRFAIRRSAGFQIGTNGLTKLVRLAQDAGVYPIIWLLYSGPVGGTTGLTYKLNIEAPYYVGTGQVFTNVAPSSNAWDQIEIEWELNTPGQSNGNLRLWVNGALAGSALNKEFVGPTPTSKCFNGANTCSSNLLIRTFQLYVQSGVGDIYFDRFAIGNSRIGIVGSAPPQDITPPNPPTNLTAQ